MAKKKKQHGGARPNSGRKVASADGKAVVVAASVPSGLAERLDEYAEERGWNRSQAITEAIRGLLDASKA